MRNVSIYLSVFRPELRAGMEKTGRERERERMKLPIMLSNLRGTYCVAELKG